ncbi:MAG TPA: hypothetical protein VJR22_03685 [Candidatus Nitrosotalea sp.]|nr:hypothetical protein [Nitrososphaerota archaeon]HKU32929.1 hypothetical protein [Candidatus Nitrosotalea sp.]
MSYQEREISRENLEKYLKVLDSDEGIRIENKDEFVFINRTSKRYCIDISRNNHDEFFYMSDVHDVLDFLADRIKNSRIFSY